jgi:hypothetical protein
MSEFAFDEVTFIDYCSDKVIYRSGLTTAIRTAAGNNPEPQLENR